MRVAIVTDAWAPQVNGVVCTLSAVCDGLAAHGHAAAVLAPDSFRTVACPTYPEIRLSVGARRGVGAWLRAARPDAIHIATEGPLGLAARRACLRRGLPFTTAFHTRYPEYLRARFGLPLAWSYAALRRFHAPSRAVLVATESVRRQIAARGFTRTVAWTRGVDTERFRPVTPTPLDLARPVFLSVGRIAVEKNLPAFLDLDLPGSKLVIGDGPLLPELRQRYPEVTFLGARSNHALAPYYAAADVFVLPSRTETFGLVMLEALACGVPVAAYPAPGPLDVIAGSGAGVLSDDLREAALEALDISRAACRTHALTFDWRRCVDQFVANLAWL